MTQIPVTTPLAGRTGNAQLQAVELVPAGSTIRLWDDNPAVLDLLGFDAVLAPIKGALGAGHIDPLTIGIQSPWGGGKSTLLELLAKDLERDSRYAVVRVDPWQFDDQDRKSVV